MPNGKFISYLRVSTTKQGESGLGIEAQRDAVAWFLITDPVKLLAYRILDPVKPEAPVDLTPQIAKRAYALYESEGRHDGHAVQDWVKAEGEIRQNAPSK